jgi:tellurite methyltransferase
VTDDRQRWDDRYATGDVPDEPAAFLLQYADLLPTRGTALDVAGGAGRNAVWLARRGLDVTLVDVSPVGLDLAARRAANAGVSVVLPGRAAGTAATAATGDHRGSLTLVECDLAREPLPRGPWDVVVIHHFLDRNVVAQVPDVLAPGGLLLFCHQTVCNLERHPRPPRHFLLDEGEMGTLAAQLGLEVLHLGEGWSDEGMHQAHLVARRPNPMGA